MADIMRVSRRDVFAAHIIASFCIGKEDKTGAELTIALRAYKIADCMVEARSRSLLFTVDNGNLAALQEILESEPELIDCEITENNGERCSLLERACRRESTEHFAIIDFLLSKGANSDFLETKKVMIREKARQHITEWKNRNQTSIGSGKAE